MLVLPSHCFKVWKILSCTSSRLTCLCKSAFYRLIIKIIPTLLMIEFRLHLSFSAFLPSGISITREERRTNWCVYVASLQQQSTCQFFVRRVHMNGRFRVIQVIMCLLTLSEMIDVDVKLLLLKCLRKKLISPTASSSSFHCPLVFRPKLATLLVLVASRWR